MQSQIPIGGLRDTTMEDQNTSIEVGELIYNTIDPLDPRKVSFDIFEAYCHEMLTTNYVGRRAYLISQMRVSTFYLLGFVFCDGACVLCVTLLSLDINKCGRQEVLFEVQLLLMRYYIYIVQTNTTHH